MRTEAKGPLVLTDGSFRFLLGVNYWPRGSNIMMWRRWDEGAIAEDINMMKYLGVRAARVFLLDEDWVTPTGDVRGSSWAGSAGSLTGSARLAWLPSSRCWWVT
ncbi:hypothetical protein [Acidilobus sp. 7A]|uniref:hypothetical protein n=1 Tax=Acidilobus sp. 7A TaxID=1577685 RepID=UPI000764E529|nr:hypothetical protein [Acidilobus sp. 7A]AMD30587.1 hypothetical protein SE86_03695 [Acidilobus sp. 7A]